MTRTSALINAQRESMAARAEENRANTKYAYCLECGMLSDCRVFFP